VEIMLRLVPSPKPSNQIALIIWTEPDVSIARKINFSDSQKHPARKSDGMAVVVNSNALAYGTCLFKTMMDHSSEPLCRLFPTIHGLALRTKIATK